ncbi:hypothetical protein CRG98_006429 [Punica granatum]|uniref:Uncharacterized protein n=1 Tax=Punica granatum TaxID=22663 RepID=A0A2I0KXV6_PUNGR|nr:hypothetical protein CRG98_006429 [Punica granatum]
MSKQGKTDSRGAESPEHPFTRRVAISGSFKSSLYGPECGLSSGPALRAFGSRGLGVSTFPWGRVTDTRERRSRHLSFYDP